MPGPWEKYASPETPAGGDGPWSKYAAKSEPAEEEGLGTGDLSMKSGLAALAGLLGFSTDAAGHKAVNAAAAGYLPQVAGAASAATGGDYTATRDAESQRLDSFSKNNPVSSGVGTAAGVGLNGAAVNALAAAPAATIGGRILQAGKTGSIMSALVNPGDTAGEVAPVQLVDRAKNAVAGGALSLGLGTALEAPGIVKEGFNAAIGAASKALGENVGYSPKPNASEIKSAAKEIGIDELPKGVLNDNKTFQKLESGLSQSASLPAKSVRNQYNKLSEGLEAAAKKIEDLRSTDSTFGAGGKIKSDLAKQVAKNTVPVEELYSDLNPVLRKIDVDGDVVNRQFGALRRNPIFQTKDGAALLDDYQSLVKSQPELASLKEMRSGLHDALGNNSTPLDEKRINAIYDAVTKIRDGSVQATKANLPAELHGEVDAVANQIGLADAAHSSNLEDLNSIKGLVGGKEVSSPASFLRKLGDMKEADIAEKAANLDVKTLQNIKDKFPSVFEKIKNAKVDDMIARSTHAVGGFKDASFLKQWEGMDQEAKDLIFTPAMQKHIDALQMVRQEIPAKLGPSGTPEGLNYMDLVNPKRNALDLGIRFALNAASEKATGAAAPAVQSVVKPAIVQGAEAIANRPTYQGSSRPTMPAASEAAPAARQAFEGSPRPSFNRSGTPPASSAQAPSDQPAKGEYKWARDGLEKLKAHGGRDPATLDALTSAMGDPAGKQMLINASDLKPGSKAMGIIMQKLKEKYGAARP